MLMLPIAGGRSMKREVLIAIECKWFVSHVGMQSDKKARKEKNAVFITIKHIRGTEQRCTKVVDKRSNRNFLKWLRGGEMYK